MKKIVNTISNFCVDTFINDPSALIVGVDEVGRGCLFGEVVACAVVLPFDDFYKLENIGVTDSKKLTAKKRQVLSPQIREIVKDYHIASVDNLIIDEINIFQASLRAMTKAIEHLSVIPSLCLVDGNALLPQLKYPQQALIKGDLRSPIIAAASILAKVYRDQKMMEYDQLYPEYDFKNNKGYGTKKHLQAIEKYGVTPFHRLSFSPCQLKEENK
ncbi:ribonuclease HII [Geminocystis sp. NIES-3708]|uniref:ribonuclease HII n=1 Tax=Geminocystis sp. NIES-3708 TaxID=1615909 RepID=UPI0005FCD77F|nr:ribonuclease HII [Geminocystis sp. NIES-3708]BAQ62756.1 ribonuclease HII [Geminocystis sp. NIES-3708]